MDVDLSKKENDRILSYAFVNQTYIEELKDKFSG
jgi:hypothetical protein